MGTCCLWTCAHLRIYLYVNTWYLPINAHRGPQGKQYHYPNFMVEDIKAWRSCRTYPKRHAHLFIKFDHGRWDRNVPPYPWGPCNTRSDGEGREKESVQGWKLWLKDRPVGKQFGEWKHVVHRKLSHRQAKKAQKTATDRNSQDSTPRFTTTPSVLPLKAGVGRDLQGRVRFWWSLILEVAL